jgi:hypothetical protein
VREKLVHHYAEVFELSTRKITLEELTTSKPNAGL